MHSSEFFLGALAFLGVSTVLVPLAKKLRLGGVVGYLLSGVLIGPGVLKVIQSPENVLAFAEFGVVLLLFLIGLELNPRKLWQMKGDLLGLGSLQVIATSLGVGLLSFLILGTITQSILVGMAFSLSSTALALQLLQEKGLTKTTAGKSAFAVLLFQDIAVIPMLALTAFLSQGTEVSSNSQSPIFMYLKAIGAIGAVLIAGRFLVRPAFRILAETKMRELLTGFSLFLVLAVSGIMHAAGISMALGSFLAGVLLAESEYRHEIEIDLEPFKGLLLGLFFVGVGMSINLNVLSTNFFSIIGITTAVVSLKLLIQYYLAYFKGHVPGDRFVFSMALSQVGEFAFVILGLGQTGNILTVDQTSTTFLVVALSMATTPGLFSFFEKWIAPKLVGASSKWSVFDKIESNSKHVILGGFGKFGQITGRLLHSQNIPITILENDPAQIELLRKFGWKCFYGDVSRLDLLEAAGAANARLLVLGIDRFEVILETIELVRSHFPKLKILARANNRPEAMRLIKMGIPHVRVMFESGIEMAELTLKNLGYKPDEAKTMVDRFRSHDLQALAESTKFVGDEQSLIALAKQQREALSTLLQGHQTSTSNQDG